MESEDDRSTRGSESRIPEKLFFRIGEVCELIKVQPHVLRYWETEFPMLAPQKNRAGQRVYRRKDVEMVLRIRDLLYEEKFTIAGAKKRLAEESRGGSVKAKPAAPQQDTPPVRQETQRASTPARTHVEKAAPEPASETQPSAPRDAQPAASPPDEPGSTALLPGLHPTASRSSEKPAPSGASLSPNARRVLRLLKTDLEDLLTRLNTDARVKP
jgi:DNA-binding transcriptional MerR regulator